VLPSLYAWGLLVAGTIVQQNNPSPENAVFGIGLATGSYLLLTGMRHGLLINLRPGQVEKRYVSTTLDMAARRRIVVHDSEWQGSNESSQRLHRLFLGLLSDWGAFLQLSLYREAIVHFFGGPAVALQKIPVYDGEAVIGGHEVCLIADDMALALTALKEGKDQMKDHLQRFLGHTELAHIQWINMDNHDIEFRTLED
jgi:hypothetical protein